MRHNRAVDISSRGSMKREHLAIHALQLRVGPEAILHRAVESKLVLLFHQGKRLVWTASSFAVGAGRPDLLMMTFEPQVVALTKLNTTDKAIITYLRTVGRATLATISERLRLSRRTALRSIASLRKAEIVTFRGDAYLLRPKWRAVIPDIISVEVKVGNWRKGVMQAVRNRIFVHRSFVALPSDVASRVKSDRLFQQFGIGILAVDALGEVRIVRRARRSIPKVWSYYYGLAAIAADHIGRSKRGISNRDRRRKKRVS